ncbi:10409_t:CDS:1 [Ambispora gerdemannii]|uniref:10409_t:CDS:1 n=1 Tax=Ambispora gerdemannii TaxID=144530 RepID=A0A9N9CAH8_9GLOM|nr:10409_t:CDS:1 [Ambispora gerdemannii]
MPKKEFEKRLELFKKVFHRKCLFCEVMIEGKGFQENESKTVLSLCEFCSRKYEVVEELKKNKEADKEQTQEIANCFYGKCYFCNEETIKRGVHEHYSYREILFGKKILSEIDACKACFSRYNALCELEQQKLEITQAQIQIPPK